MTNSICTTGVRPQRGPRRWMLAIPVLVIPLFTGACNLDNLLAVQDPDIVTPENLAGEAGLATLRAGALGDFALALSGSTAGHGATPGLLHYTSSLTDEITYSGTFPTRREFDERRVQERNGDLARLYANLHRARIAAENATAAIEQYSSVAADPRRAELQGLAGYVRVFFGEAFCSGVPFSSAPPSGELVFGTPLTTAQMFQDAATLFDQAIGGAGSSTREQYLARIGKGRALVGLGRFAEAAQAVAPVPTGYEYMIEHSANSLREQNGMYHLSATDRQYSVSDQEAGTGLRYRSANDARVPWTRVEGEVGQDGSTPFFRQLLYPGYAAPVPLATGVEARLIEAEAALRAGGYATPGTGTLATLNALRAGAGMAPLAPAATTAAQEDQLFAERAFWLYLTTHRLGDLRRLSRPQANGGYGRNPETVFPTGSYFKGGVYGPDVNFPVPVQERNNPNFTGCLSRAP